MDHLARKISRAKWERKDYMATDEIGADAITACLRTKDNALSVWQCDLEDASIRDVILALASSMDRLDTIQLVVLAKADLEHDDITLEETLGVTSVEDLKDRHTDLVKLDMIRICKVAERIAAKVRSDSNLYLYTYTRSKVRDVVTEAVTLGRVQINQLKDEIREAVRGRQG